VNVALAGPKLRPRTSLQRAEVVDLHHAPTALTHELKASIQIQYLDAVPAARQHSLHKERVIDKLRAGSPEIVLHLIDKRISIHGNSRLS